MSTLTLSDKGQPMIPAAIPHRLGAKPSMKPEFKLERDSIRCQIPLCDKAHTARKRIWHTAT